MKLIVLTRKCAKGPLPLRLRAGGRGEGGGGVDLILNSCLCICLFLLLCAVGGFWHEAEALVIFDPVAGHRGIPRRCGGAGTASTRVRAALTL